MNRDWWTLLFSFEGRIPRAEYWWGQGALLAGVVLPSMVGGILAAIFKGTIIAPAFGVIFGLAAVVGIIAFFCGSFALICKRLHDHNLSGWWYLACGIPYIGPICLGIALGFIRGTVGPNRFGEDCTDMVNPPTAARTRIRMT